MERNELNSNPQADLKNAKWFSQLSDAEQAIFVKIPEKVDFMDHPLFHESGAEKTFFGPEAESVRVPVWSMFSEDLDSLDVPSGRRSKLSGKEEELLFLKYNYACFRLAEVQDLHNQRKTAARARNMVLWQQHVLQVRSELAKANMALVVAMAKRTRIPNCDFAELISEGNLALLRSIEKFDVSRGFKFSTYACRAILKSYNRLASKTGRYRQLFPTEFDPELERSDWDGRQHEMQLDSRIEDLRDVLVKNRAHLTDTEQLIVMERFAIGREGKGRTLAQLSEIVGLTNERIRQIQNRALGKLRHAMDAEVKVA